MKLRHDHTAATAGIARLLELVEKGLMEAEDPVMRERLVALKLKRDQIARAIAELQDRMASSTPTITPDKVARIGVLLRDKLYEGPAEFRQAYARLLLDEVRITEEEIRISGSKSVLANCASHGTVEPVPKVLSFVREWRGRRDSNPRAQPWQYYSARRRDPAKPAAAADRRGRPPSPPPHLPHQTERRPSSTPRP